MTNQTVRNTCLYTMIYDLLPIVNRLTRVGKGNYIKDKGRYYET